MTPPHPLARLPLDRLARRLEADTSSQHHLVATYLDLFEQRNDAPAELFEAIPSIGSESAAGAALVVGILRATERGEPVPASVDPHFFFKRWAEESWSLLAEWPGLARTHAAVRALGPARGRAVAKRLLDDKYKYATGWLLLPLFEGDTALLDEALARLPAWQFPSSEIAMGVSLLPLAKLPTIGTRLRALGAVKGAELLRLGIQGALARAAARGEPWPESLDAELDVHSVFPSGGSLFDAYAAPLLRAAVSGLPAERARVWLDAQLGGPPPSRDRIVAAVPPTDTALAARTLAVLAVDPKGVTKEGWSRLAQLARDVGAGATAIAEGLPAGKVRARFEDAMAAQPAPLAAEAKAKERAAKPKRKAPARATKVAKPSSAVQKAQWLAERALAASPGAPRARITIIEAGRGAPAVPEGGGAVSRVGGPGYRLGDRRPTSEGDAMTHVFTLALADVPTDAFAGAVAFALYVSDPRASDPDGGAAEVVALGADDLARGADDDAPGDLPCVAVLATTFDVPSSALERDDRSELARALRALPARAGGQPHWLQEPEEAGTFVLQFDERFAPLNLGDRGVMYVFRDAALWQSR